VAGPAQAGRPGRASGSRSNRRADRSVGWTVPGITQSLAKKPNPSQALRVGTRIV